VAAAAKVAHHNSVDISIFLGDIYRSTDGKYNHGVDMSRLWPLMTFAGVVVVVPVGMGMVGRW
jgi:hypothetical protein